MFDRHRGAWRRPVTALAGLGLVAGTLMMASPAAQAAAPATEATAAPAQTYSIEIPCNRGAANYGIPSIGAEETLDVRAGTQSGEQLTLRARGVPHLRGTGRGDLHVRLEVQTPTRLDAEQERLLRELAALRDEERPVATVQPQEEAGGLFSRLKGAFTGR